MQQLPMFPNRNLLSRREKETVSHIVQGLSNKETARLMEISPRTVEDMRANALRKLQVKNTVQLVRYVYQLGGEDDRVAIQKVS